MQDLSYSNIIHHHDVRATVNFYHKTTTSTTTEKKEQDIFVFSLAIAIKRSGKKVGKKNK
jgi:hypothetical protein